MLSASGGLWPLTRGSVPGPRWGLCPQTPIIRLYIWIKVLLFYCCKAMVRPHLEYANSVWCPFKKGDIENIEKVQKKSYKVNYILKEITLP